MGKSDRQIQDGDSMTVRYVRHAAVAEYEAARWVQSDALRGTYHGRFAALMIKREQAFA